MKQLNKELDSLIHSLEESKLRGSYKKDLLSWIKNDDKAEEGAGFASALVNLVDTVIEGRLPKSGNQKAREKAYIEFMLQHNQHNQMESSEDRTRPLEEEKRF